jgi:hypothetical protein
VRCIARVDLPPGRDREVGPSPSVLGDSDQEEELRVIRSPVREPAQMLERRVVPPVEQLLFCLLQVGAVPASLECSVAEHRHAGRDGHQGEREPQDDGSPPHFDLPRGYGAKRVGRRKVSPVDPDTPTASHLQINRAVSTGHLMRAPADTIDGHRPGHHSDRSESVGADDFAAGAGV